MSLVDIAVPNGILSHTKYQGVFATMATVTMLVVVALDCFKDVHPLNYGLLGVVTVLVGLSWGFGFNAFGTRLHFQLVGILGLGLCVAMAASMLLSWTHRLPDMAVVVVSLLLGWVVGSCVDLAAVAILGLPLSWAFTAVLVALFLFGVLLLNAGPMLARCNPDDFMPVVVSMNSALLVVISVPVFVLLECWLRLGHIQEPAEEDQRVQEVGMP
mmetsp:Transcript_12965/g.40729  ORF Transcript_12965/g.40729 Transcript_12965/m.40729 type:complete len:214 (+) Transcript_12965:341-982(+)